MTLHRYAKNYVSRFEKKLFSPYKGLSGMVMPLFLHEMGNRLALADCLKSCALCCTCIARCVFEKFSTKLVKTFDRLCKIFEKLFVFDDFFVFMSPNAQNDSLLRWVWGFNVKRGWLIRRNIPLKKNNDANPCRVNEINSYICSCLTQVSAFAKNNIYDVI